jgi:hypothetical protein
MCVRLARGMERRKIGVSSLIVGGILIIILLFFISDKKPLPHVEIEKPDRNHLLCDGKICRHTEYCFLDRSQRSEGNNSGVSSNWKLAHVVINIRHGDRTSIHRLGNHGSTTSTFTSK